MSTMKVQNNKAGRDNRAAAPPVKEDGTLFKYVYYPFNYSYAFYADTLSELISGFIPQYHEENEEDRKTARENFALSTMYDMRIQTMSLVDAVADIEITDWEQEELRYHNNLRHIPQNWTEEHNNTWVCEAPLVLLREDYAPYTENIAPKAITQDSRGLDENIVWLTFTDEKEFLESMTRIGRVLAGSPNYASHKRQTIKR